MDVHPPHGPIHSWRDFLIHLLTITIGLLIALGLEGLVEWAHHRHLVHRAYATIQREMQENASTAAKDAQWIREDEQRIQQDIQTLLSLRAGKKIEHGSLEYNERWDSLSSAAWQTAHASGAMNYLDYAEAQAIAEVYGQQEITNTFGLEAYKSHTMAISPLFISGDPNSMTREEVQLSLQRSADLLLNLRTLEQLLVQLQKNYADELKRME